MDYAAFCHRFDVSRETFDRLCAYREILLKWQHSLNLISPKTIDALWERHILDCCQFAPLIVSRETSIIDLGSGAGLPGIILAILGCGAVTLVESDQRKSVFLREAARQLSLSIIVLNQRIEEISGCYDVITARACAPLGQLLDWAYPLMRPDSICLFAKGKNYANEIEEASAAWQWDGTIHPSQTEAGSAILAVRQLMMRS